VTLPRTLVSYISKEYLLSFFIAFLFFIAIFFVNQILYLARDRLAQSVSLFDTLRLVVYAMPAIVALSFPFGSLLGVLMTLGKFSSENETMAAQAAGIGLHQLFVPLLILGIGLSGISFGVNDYLLPLGTLRYTTLYQELLFANSELALSPNTVQRYERTTIVTGPAQDGVFLNTTLLDTSEDGKSRVITAGTVQITRNARQDGVISLDLTDVQIHETDPQNPQDFTSLKAERMTYSILLREINNSIRNPGPREMSILDLWDLIQSRRTLLSERWGDGESRADRTLQLYWIEFWKKIAIPFSSFTFLVLGFPLGLSARHNGRSVGFGLGVLLSVMYWGMLLGAETLGSRYLELPPGPIIFLPNILMLVGGIGLYLSKVRR